MESVWSFDIQGLYTYLFLPKVLNFNDFLALMLVSCTYFELLLDKIGSLG